MIAIDYDPFARGFVTNLARPSGNVIGVVFQQIELAAKRIQLIKDAFPDRPAATMFWDHLSVDQWQAARSAATTLGLQLSGIELRELPYDYDAALDQAPLDRRDMLIMPTSPFFFRDRAPSGRRRLCRDGHALGEARRADCSCLRQVTMQLSGAGFSGCL
jgi:putative ABC transport system substrate-binding protein